MAKKSFFERLTGATKLEEESENFDEELKEKPLQKDYFEIKEEVEKPKIELTAAKEKPSPVRTSSPKKTSPKTTGKLPTKSRGSSTQSVGTKKPSKKEEWLTETEGQLTIDVYQTDSDVVIKSTIAGVRAEDIDVTITNDMVTIKGSRTRDEKVTEEDYYYQELYWGAFSRSVILPVDVLADKTKAAMKNGILTILLPKAERLTTKKIKVKSEQ